MVLVYQPASGAANEKLQTALSDWRSPVYFVTIDLRNSQNHMTPWEIVIDRPSKSGVRFMNFCAAIASALVLVVGQHASAQDVDSPKQVSKPTIPAPGSGLEVESPTLMPVLIEELSEDAAKLGLTRDRVEARVNSTLRKNGLRPVEALGSEHDYYYYVQVSIVGRSVAINVGFHRVVMYGIADNLRTANAATWNRGMSGGLSSSVARVLDDVADMTEMFVDAFLKANRK